MKLSTPLRLVFRFSVVLTFLLSTNLISSLSYAQEAQVIGRVLLASGMVTASDPEDNVRELQRGSEIFLGDTIATGPNGAAQVKMIDDAKISFKSSTLFTFQTYSTDGPGGAPDSALMNMVQGGFRTISGTIGDDTADQYEVSTQFASIGIRGTTHEAVIDQGSLLTGVYDGGTNISNAQGSLDTGIGANFDYSQTFPGQAPQGLLQQPLQLGQINLNPNAGGGDDDDAGNDDDDDGGLADADDEDPATRPPANNQQEDEQGQRQLLANLDNGQNNNADPALDNRRNDPEINPALDIRDAEDFFETGTGNIAFIQPSEDFLALVNNSGFSTSFQLSQLQGSSGQLSRVLAFDGLADIGGGIGAAAVGDAGPTTPITALTMTFDLDFSAALGAVSNGFLQVRMDEAPQAIAFNIYFEGSVSNSIANLIISSSSNRTQGNTSTAIDTRVSFIDAILVDDGSEQALFSEFSLQDTQGLAVEGQTLVGFSPLDPVLSPADSARISDRVGFVINLNNRGVIQAGNITALVSGQEVILAGNDTPFTFSNEPPFIYRGAGSFLAFEDGNSTAEDENPYDVEAGIWGSTQNPVRLYENFADSASFQQLTDPLIVTSADPTSLSALTGTATYLSNFDRILGTSTLGGAITEFITAFDVDFNSALVTNGFMEFCIGGDQSCNGNNAQFWELDYSGSVINGYVVAQPISNTGEINNQNASIYGSIQGLFVGDNADAFGGGFNLFYDPDLDEFLGQASGFASGIPETTVAGAFLIEREDRFSVSEIEDDVGNDGGLDDDSFLVQENYARILLGYSRPTASEAILFVDSRSRPRLVLRDVGSQVTVSQQNQNLTPSIAESFDVNWERWEGPLVEFPDNLDSGNYSMGQASDVAFFSTFDISNKTDITGHYGDVLGFIGEDQDGNQFNSLIMSFDVNFSADRNNISNGQLDINVNFDDWRVFFEGSLENNTVEFNLLAADPNNAQNLSGIYCDGLCEYLDLADSNMQGAIVDNGQAPALLSSFYFREDGGDMNSVSGMALVSTSDPRLTSFGVSELNDLFAHNTNPLDETDTHEHISVFVDSSYESGGVIIPGAVSFGRATHPVIMDSGSYISDPDTSPKIALNDRGSQSFGSIDLDPVYDEVITGTSSLTSLGENANILTNVQGFDVDMGYWAKDDMTIMNNSLNDASVTTATNDAFWANVIPSDEMEIANRSGDFTYYSHDYIGQGSSTDGLINSLSMTVQVDFADSTPIGSGSLNVDQGNNSWYVPITGGTLQGALVDFATDPGNLNGCSGCVSSDINGVLTGTVDGAIVTGFSLQNTLGSGTGLEFVDGITILTTDINYDYYYD